MLNATLFIYLLVCLFVCLFVSKMPTQCVFEIHPIMNGEWIRIYVNYLQFASVIAETDMLFLCAQTVHDMKLGFNNVQYV